MQQPPPREVINHAVNGLAVLEERQRDGAAGDSQREVVGAVDRIQHPRVTRGHGNRPSGLGEFLAEELVRRKPRRKQTEDVLRNRDVDRGHPRAIMLPAALHPPELTVEQVDLRQDRGLGGLDAGKEFR